MAPRFEPQTGATTGELPRPHRSTRQHGMAPRLPPCPQEIQGDLGKFGGIQGDVIKSPLKSANPRSLRPLPHWQPHWEPYPQPPPA